MAKTQVLIFTGPPTAGKTEAMGWCRLHIAEPTICYSMVDKAKEIATQYKWWDEDNKTPDTRAFLFELKNLLDKYFDTSFQYLKRVIMLERDHLDCLGYEYTPIFVLICSKEIKDIKRLVEEFNADVIFIDDEGIRSNFVKSNSADGTDFEKELKENGIKYNVIKNIYDLDTFYRNISSTLKSLEVPVNDKFGSMASNGNMDTRYN